MNTRHLRRVGIVALTALALTAFTVVAQDKPGKTASTTIESGESASPAAEFTENEPNDTRDTAELLLVGHTLSGAIQTAEDYDWFRLAGYAHQAYVFDIDAEVNGSSLDAYICVSGFRDGVLVDNHCNDDSDGLDSMVFTTIWPEDDVVWYVWVTDYNLDGGADYTYTLMVYTPLLVSAAVNGSVAGLPFQKSDVLAHYDFPDGTEKWMLFFDASDLGLTQNLNSFNLGYFDDAVLGFAANQPLPGGETATPWDIVDLRNATFGPSTHGDLSFVVNGRGNAGLTTAGEKIDALGHGDYNYWTVSTAGTADVPIYGQAPLRARDEDMLGMVWELEGLWDSTLYFDGSLVPGLAGEDITAASTGGRYAYFVIEGSGRVDGFAVNQKDIFVVDRDGNRVLGTYWRGGQHHFPYKLDAIHVLAR